MIGAEEAVAVEVSVTPDSVGGGTTETLLSVADVAPELLVSVDGGADEPGGVVDASGGADKPEAGGAGGTEMLLVVPGSAEDSVEVGGGTVGVAD